MSAIKKKDPKLPQMLSDTPEKTMSRRQAVMAQYENKVTESLDQNEEPTGLSAEKPVGALCYLPKSIHRLASRAAEDRDITSKRFFRELLLIGLEQLGVIDAEMHEEALKIPAEYGWKGRKLEQ